MKEIENQKTRAQGSEKLFEISWTEAEHCFVLVRSKSKKEVLELFEKGDNCIWDNLQFGHRERIDEPRVKEVKVWSAK